MIVEIVAAAESVARSVGPVYQEVGFPWSGVFQGVLVALLGWLIMETYRTRSKSLDKVTEVHWAISAEIQELRGRLNYGLSALSREVAQVMKWIEGHEKLDDERHRSTLDSLERLRKAGEGGDQIV